MSGAAELTAELREFVDTHWAGEPEDVRRLRGFSLPPMGNLPCVLYCNFDLFWACEQLQVVRNAARSGELDPATGAGILALLLERSAARAGKWEMEDTVAMLRRAAQTLRSWTPADAQELVGVCQELMIAVDTVQAKVDALIPWNELDGAVALRGPLA